MVLARSLPWPPSPPEVWAVCLSDPLGSQAASLFLSPPSLLSRRWTSGRSRNGEERPLWSRPPARLSFPSLQLLCQLPALLCPLFGKTRLTSRLTLGCRH